VVVVVVVVVVAVAVMVVVLLLVDQLIGPIPNAFQIFRILQVLFLPEPSHCTFCLATSP